MKYFLQRAIKIVFFVGIFLFMWSFVYGQEENILQLVQEDVDIEKSGGDSGEENIKKDEIESEIGKEEEEEEEEEIEEKKGVYINEVRFTGGPGKTNEDFIEIYNSSQDAVNISNWSLHKITSKDKEVACLSEPFYTFSDIHIESEKLYVLANTENGYAESIGSDFKKGFTVALGNTVVLCNKNKEIIDSVFLDTLFEKFYSIAFFEKETLWMGQYQSTPGKNNEKEKAKEYKKTLRFNELLPRPSTGAKDEFIEIFNFGEESISLEGWKIQDRSGKSISLSGEVEVKKFFLDEAKFSLIDKGNTLELVAPDLQIMDSVSYPEAEYGKSYSFNGEVWRWVCNETPREENNFLGFEGVKTVRLEELLPDPDTSQQEEFIELYNYGERDVDLSGWFITDKTTKKPLSGILAPDNYRVEYFRNFLNNSDEKISLLDRCGGIVDEFEYKDSQKGKSWARDENSWKETPFVTKEEKNIFAKKIENSTIRLNEIFPRPSQEGKESEFVEIYNFGENPVDISFWSLGDETKNRYTFPNQSVLMPREYRVVYGREASFALNDQGKETVYLFDSAGFVVESMSYEKPTQDFSFIFFEEDSLWKKTPYRSPKEKNIFPQSQMGATIRLNEILPNPKEDEEKNEYIELYNFGEKPVDISFWQIADASLQGYIFPQNTLLSAGEYKILYREEFLFSLNNTKESLSLFDASGYKIDTASWESSKENISKNRDGNELRNSKHLTPGEKNKLNNLPKIKEKDIPNKGYVGVKTLFSIRAEDKDGDDLTYRWEFGNSKKSYREKTSHTYEKKGTYNVTLRVSDGIEEVFISRDISITTYPKFKAKIIALLPNPAGKDTEGEWIEIYNEDGKTLNLIGWSIATGENFEKLTNHPIHKNIQIKPKESAKIYRTQSSFSLRNSSGAIELRQPNKKVSDALSYEKEKILDDEEYRFSSGSWTWALPYSTSTQEPLQENQELQEEMLIQEELVLGSSIEKKRNAFQEIYFFLYENEINFNQKRELSKKENIFIFTRDGVMKSRLWWKRCLWGDCLEG